MYSIFCISSLGRYKVILKVMLNRIHDYFFLLILIFFNVLLFKSLELNDFYTFKPAVFWDGIIESFSLFVIFLMIPNILVLSVAGGNKKLTFRKCIKYSIQTQFYANILFVILNLNRGDICPPPPTPPYEFYIFFNMFMGIILGVLYMYLDRKFFLFHAVVSC